MYLTIPFENKDDIGNFLLEKGFEKEAGKFLEPHYAGNNNKINIHLKTVLTEEFLLTLMEIAEKLELRGLKTQSKQCLALINDPASEKIKTLKSFETGMANYIQKGAIKGWVFNLDHTSNYIPYAVSSIWYRPSEPRTGAEALVNVELESNSPKESSYRGSRNMISFTISDVKGKSIPEALAMKGYYKENQDLIDEYIASTDAYLKFQPMFGKQFLGKGDVTTELNHRRTALKLDGKKRVKMVNDDNGAGDSRIFETYTTFQFWENRDVPESVFGEIPFHPYISMFDLNAHTHYWVLARQLYPYTYDPTVGDKLILPEIQRDLVSILTEDMDVVKDDIVEGKSGGTTILCMGEPGLGKTLTAEIYSEVIGRPLYRVHSGQLGTDPEKIEQRLETILTRTEEWGCIALLDEADVYIRKRDNSMEHNAIVAAFLRKLEYFSGLLFMTTNRAEDVDDAIKSRCMAIIKYETPSKENAALIWKTISTQFEMDLKDSVIAELVEEYPTCNGRDIKELLKLAGKYNKMKGRALDSETFRHCAIFRGISHR